MPTSAPDLQREMLLLVTARVRDAYLRKPVYVDGAQDLEGVCRRMAQLGVTFVLVRDGERLGLFTTTDLRDAVVRAAALDRVPVRDVARFDLVTVHPDSELFEALWLMERHRVHRLVVYEDGEVLGVLAQLDLVSFVANHSHIVAAQIDDATRVPELKSAAQRIDEMVVLLYEGGIKIERVARLVGELNTRLFAKLWLLLAPGELQANSCLVVMGSEGRGEQILKTDQDNALLVRDGFTYDGLEQLAQQFNSALADFGYPPCPGDIMLTNPQWRQPLAEFRSTIRGWIYGGDAQGIVNLAIFFDAVAVAGDARLLQEARTYLDTILAHDDAFLARFAGAADQFAEPGNWWTRLTARRDEQPIDLKKLGTFPIVHGVRALALKHHVRALSTAARLRALVDGHHLESVLARDLLDALHFLMGLKLRHQLLQREAGEPATNLVRPSALGTLEREMLADSLAIIKRFRESLRLHFRFDSL